MGLKYSLNPYTRNLEGLGFLVSGLFAFQRVHKQEKYSSVFQYMYSLLKKIRYVVSVRLVWRSHDTCI